MPQRILLPLDLAGANAIEIEGEFEVVRTRLSDVGQSTLAHDAMVLLVVPSLAVLLQAAWLEDLRALGQRSFSAWWARASAARSPGDGWRYDEVIASWARLVGPDRVHVVVGEDLAAASCLLEAHVGGATLAPEPWLRSLRAGEVRMVEELMAEMAAQGMVGRNAADLVHGGADAQRRTPSQEPPSLPPIESAGAESPAAGLATRMEARLDALGVHVHGDRSALGLPVIHDVPAAVVPLSNSLTLMAGMLERVTTWGVTGELAE